jgi:hypothetical protein
MTSSHIYNEERPHQSLGDATPADLYTPSPRRFDGILREPEYDAGLEVRQVRHNGEIRWRNETIYLNQALAGEPVALEEDATGWTVSYGPVMLGTIAHNDNRLRKPKPKKQKSCVFGSFFVAAEGKPQIAG